MAYFLACCLGWGCMGAGLALINAMGKDPSAGLVMFSIILLFSGGTIIWFVSETGRMILKGILFIVLILIGSSLWDNRNK